MRRVYRAFPLEGGTNCGGQGMLSPAPRNLKFHAARRRKITPTSHRTLPARHSSESYLKAAGKLIASLAGHNRRGEKTPD
jgi:hypothetical protein